MSRTPRAALLLLLLCGGVNPALAASPGAAKEELRQLKSRIETLQKQLAATEETKTEAADALRESERAISEANRSLRELAQQSSALGAQLSQLQSQSGRAEQSLESQQQLLARLLYREYLQGQPETLRLLLNREDPNQIARDLHYYSYISRARAAQIGQLRQNLAQLREIAQEVEHKASELSAVVAEQTTQKKRLEQEKRARGLMLARVSRDIQKQRREMGTLKRDENRLTRLVEQLGRIVSRSPAPRPPPKSRTRNERVPEVQQEAGPFARLKGKLALPVRGELGNRYGSPRTDGGAIWRGLFIAAPAGQEIRAVAAGRVVFADWLRGFGNLLIVDHGDGYMSLYGYNETLFKRVGDPVNAGEPVAAVGNSGGGTDSGLYFELRHQGKPFDPLAWVSIQ